MPNLIFELAVQKKQPNGTVPLIARLIFKRKKVERTVIRVTEVQAEGNGSLEVQKSIVRNSPLKIIFQGID